MSSLDAAERQVRDYIETAMGVDTTGAKIAIDKAEPLDLTTSMDEDEQRPSE